MYRITWPILLIGSLAGCCSTPVDTAIGIPRGPNLQPITQELWNDIPPHTRKIISDNGLEWEKFYKNVTDRIREHDAALDD